MKLLQCLAASGLALAACVPGPGDGNPDSTSDRHDTMGEESREPAHEHMAAELVTNEHDDGCFSGYRQPVEVQWVTREGAPPEISVHFDTAYAPEDRVEVQFYLVPLPAKGRPQEAGAPVSLPLRGDARVAVPDEIAAAVRSGGPHVAFALFKGCEADDPHGNCLIRNSGELHIEDGRVFLPRDYQAYLRKKWSAAKPWLFQDGVVTLIVDGKGQ